MAVHSLDQQTNQQPNPSGVSPKLTAVILTLNEEKHIEDCIKSLAWADDVLVFDSFSEDGTVALAEAAGAIVRQSPF